MKPRKFLVEIVHRVVVTHVVEAENPYEAVNKALDADVPDGDAEIGEPVGVQSVLEAT